jgi:hypothetical protein
MKSKSAVFQIWSYFLSICMNFSRFPLAFVTVCHSVLVICDDCFWGISYWNVRLNSPRIWLHPILSISFIFCRWVSPLGYCSTYVPYSKFIPKCIIHIPLYEWNHWWMRFIYFVGVQDDAKLTRMEEQIFLCSPLRSLCIPQLFNLLCCFVSMVAFLFLFVS